MEKEGSRVKRFMMLCLFAIMVLGLIGGASAQTTVPNVSGLRPFTAETRYMSLPGYLRWQYHQETARWITWGEAVAMVRDQTTAVAALPSV
jgi:hypothetical protein